MQSGFHDQTQLLSSHALRHWHWLTGYIFTSIGLPIAVHRQRLLTAGVKFQSRLISDFHPEHVPGPYGLLRFAVGNSETRECLATDLRRLHVFNVQNCTCIYTEWPIQRAGNTGAGVYKNWPSEAVVVDVRGVAELAYQRTSSKARQKQSLLSDLALVPIPMAVEEPPGSTLLSLSPADLITSRCHQAASKKGMRSAKHVARQPS